MYVWVVYLHVVVIFVFLIQHAAEIIVTFKLRGKDEPQDVFGTYTFLPENNSRNLRITYSLIVLSGAAAGFMSAWWRQGWMWTALGIMIVLWVVMHRVGGGYLTAVDAITEAALKDKDDPSALDRFRRTLKARREPEIMTVSSVVGGLVILWLMMFKPF
jgi:hypothetical protein